MIIIKVKRKRLKRPSGGFGWRRGKTGSKTIGDTEKRRNKKRQEELENIKLKLELLGDPFDEMNIDEKKKHALYWFFSFVKVCLQFHLFANVVGQQQIPFLDLHKNLSCKDD